MEKTQVGSCRGLFGKVFGHRFVEAANTEESGLVTEQLGKLAEFVREDKSLGTSVIKQLIEGAITRTSIIKAIYCDRCGEDRMLNDNRVTGH